MFLWQFWDFRFKGTHRLKEIGCNKIFHLNGSKHRVVVAMLLVMVDLESKTGQETRKILIMIKVSIEQGDITIINTHALIFSVPTYVKQHFPELKREIDSNTW